MAKRPTSKTPGLCTNTANCAVARSGKPAMVSLDQPFRCPSCGGLLTPPDPAGMRRSLVVPLLASGAVILLVLLAIIWLARPKPPMHATLVSPQAQTKAPATAPQEAKTAAAPESEPEPAPALPPIGSGQIGTTPPNPNLVGSSSPAGPTSATLLANPPHPSATPSPAAPAAAPPAAAPPAVTPAKPPAHAKPRHRVVAARNNPKAREGEISAEMLPLDGSRPDYPAAYEDQAIQGSVSVTCFILVTGKATSCHVVQRAGGPRFAESVQAWLARDSTRFPPLQHNGHPIPARFTWNIQFFP